VRSADDADFTEFVAGSSRRLLGLAYLLTGDADAAASLLDGALERTYRRWPRLNRDGAPEAYVRRMLINATTAGWRRQKRVGRPGNEDGAAPADALMNAVATLPARQRTALVLRYYEGFTDEQAAAVMGCSLGAFESQQARAIGRLRALRPEGSW
jgi:RNA polymerase sigma-70 factor (sigma-E family)